MNIVGSLKRIAVEKVELFKQFERSLKTLINLAEPIATCSKASKLMYIIHSAATPLWLHNCVAYITFILSKLEE